MNELIAKLYDQATILEGNGDYVAGELDPVKFAELIVRECAQLVEDNMDPQNAWITPGYVKQHFGVEERKDLVCPKCGVDRTLVDELQIECDRLYRIIELNGILK